MRNLPTADAALDLFAKRKLETGAAQSYAQALGMVAAEDREAKRSKDPRLADAALAKRAEQYAAKNNVTYAEALVAVSTPNTTLTANRR